MTRNNDIISAAMEYASYGWRVIPISPKNKYPPLKEWQKLATTSEDQIIEWWEGQFSGCGVGVQFGEASGIVDIEIDSAEADENLRTAFGGEIPPTPTFTSAKRKLPHRIFQFREDLPEQANFDLRPLGIEADLKIGHRGLGSQSVFPPSFNGGYRWLPGLSSGEIQPAEIPSLFIAILTNEKFPVPLKSTTTTRKTADEWDELLKGSVDGSRNKDLTSIAGKLAREYSNLDSKEAIQFIFSILLGQNKLNDPPLAESDVLVIARSIIGRERQRRASEELAVISSPTTEQSLKTGAEKESMFKLVVVKSEPPQYRLYADVFSAARGGYITLTAKELRSWNLICTAALDQAMHYLPSSRSIVARWQGKGGLASSLMDSAERIEAPEEEKRFSVVAQRIVEYLEKGKDAEQPDSTGNPVRLLTDGSYVFRFNHLWDELRFSADKILRSEISDVLTTFNITKYTPELAGRRRQFCRLSKDNLNDMIRTAFGTSM